MNKEIDEEIHKINEAVRASLLMVVRRFVLNTGGWAAAVVTLLLLGIAAARGWFCDTEL